LISIFALSFLASLPSAQAQSLEASFSLHPPQQVAQHLFQNLFTLNPKNEDYYLRVGLAELEKGNSQKSADLFAKALNLKRQKVKLYLKIGLAFLKKS